MLSGYCDSTRHLCMDRAAFKYFSIILGTKLCKTFAYSIVRTESEVFLEFIHVVNPLRQILQHKI